MKTINDINKTRGALKRFGLALAASAAVVLGSGLTANAAPTNDNFTSAIELIGATGTQTGTDTIDATLQAGEPDPGATNTVWFKWTCTADGNLTVSTLGSTDPVPGEWDAILGIYTGASVNALTPLGATPQDTGYEETMTVPVTAGTTYYIQLAGYANTVAANIILNWTLVPTIYEADILTFGPGGVIDQGLKTILWAVPFGTDLATLAPTFTLSPGATCTVGGLPVHSGDPVNLTSPVVFKVTAKGSSPIVNDYTVTLKFVPTLIWNTTSGDWDFTTTNWIEQTSGSSQLYADGLFVIFNNPLGGAINITSAVLPLSTTVSNGDYTISGGPITGTGSLTKTGSGTLTLDSGNSYSGDTVVNAGTLVANGNGAIAGTPSFAVAGGATLLLSGGTGAYKWPQATPIAATPLTGAGTVGIPLGRGINVGLNFDMSAFTGILDLTNGMVAVNPTYSQYFVSATNGTIKVEPNTTLYLGWTGFRLNTTVQLMGGPDNGENLGQLRADNGTLDGAVILGANSTIGSALTINAVISDGGNGFGFTKISSGTVVLTATNTYTGPTIVRTGTLQCNNPDALGNGGVLSINAGATVNLNYTGSHNVGSLTLGGVAQLPGSHGSSSSGALFPDDAYFSGTGTVTVAGVVKPLILAFGLPNNPAVINQNANTITLRVPYGTDVAHLAPTYTLSYGTCTPASGSTQNFTSPVTYAASSGALTNTYVVTVSVRPQVPPMSITAGLVMWLDASQLTGLTNSAPMTTWTDMSGLGNHATKTAGSPKYKTGALGGQPVVQFVRANGDKFTTADLSSQFPTAGTILIVSTLRATGGAYTLVNTGTGNTHDEWWRYDGNGNSYPAAFRNQRLESYCSMPNSGSHVFAVSSSDSWQMWVDGSSPGVALGNYSPGGAQDVGNGSTGGGLEGDIAEVLSYSRTLSNDELNYLGYYLTAKYDLNTAYTVGNSITSFSVPGQSSSVIAGTNIYVTVPSGTALNPMTPTITVSMGATVTPASGVARDFSSPQVTYTVQALDGTTKAYQVTVMDSSKRISGNIGSNASVLEGPAGGGLDMVWNDGLGAGASELMDGSGAVTTVGYTSGGTSWGGPDSWGTPTLELLRQGLRNFSSTPGNSQYITFTNLPYRKYNVYIASANCMRIGNSGNNQRGNGVWSTPNTTSTPGDHKCSNVTVVNGSTWVEGNNYVAFLNVLPDDTGKITINGYAIPVDTYDCRLPLNGFQLVDVGAAPLRTGKVMSNVFFPGLGSAYVADSTGTNLFLQVPIGTPVAALAPTYTVSTSATGNPVSGTTRDFTTKQTYTITAEDLSQQAYSVTVVPVAPGLGYTALIQAAGPVAFWPLNEISGTTATDVVGGHNATYEGSVTLGVAGMVPRSSQMAANFVPDSQASTAYSASLNPAQFTVEGWIRPNDLAGAYLISLQDRSSGVPSGGRWGYAIMKNNGGVCFSVMCGQPGTSFTTVQGTTPVKMGTVYYVVGTYDGTTLRLYVNGVLENSAVTAYQQATATQPGFTIGARNSVGYANASIQDVAIYNRALSAQEIQTHYHNTPILKVGMAAGQVILNWEPGIMLQHAAPNVTGTYTNVPTATSPWPITPAGTSEFWRLKTQ